MENVQSLKPWFYLSGATGVTAQEIADFNLFADKVAEDIPRFFRSHDFDNNYKLHVLNGKPIHVMVLKFVTKQGNDSTGLIGYFNESLGDGMTSGSTFIEVTRQIIAADAKKKGINVTFAKESVLPIITESSPASAAEYAAKVQNFPSYLKDLMTQNKEMYNYSLRGKKVNLLTLAGDFKIECAGTTLPGDGALTVSDAKSMVQLLYEKVKLENKTGSIAFESLFEGVQQKNIKLETKVTYDSGANAQIIKEYGKARNVFHLSRNSLPDEFKQIADAALKNKEISKPTYDYLLTLNETKFYDTKFKCVNDQGVMLARERTLKNPELAKNFIGIVGADELAYQIIVNGKAYNISLDINNLGGINTKYGMAVGDIYIESFVTTFNKDIIPLLASGNIEDVREVFPKYFDVINNSVRSVPIARLTPEQLQVLKESGGKVNIKEKTVEFTLFDLRRPYSKMKTVKGVPTKISRKADKGATATVFAELISAENRTSLQHEYERHEKAVKDLKSGNSGSIKGNAACLKGELVIEIREYRVAPDGNGRLLTTLITKDYNNTKSKVEMEIKEKHIPRKNNKKAGEVKIADNTKVITIKSQGKKVVEIRVFNNGKMTKFEGVKGGTKLGAGMGLAFSLAEKVAAGDDMTSGEVWVDVVKQTGTGGLVGATWGTLLPLVAKKYRIVGGAGIGSGIELVTAGMDNKSLYGSENPYVRSHAGYDTTWRVAKGGASGAMFLAVEGVFSAPSGGSLAVPGFFAGMAASAETDYLLTSGGDWVSKKTGYEEGFKVNVMKQYFHDQCGIELEAPVQPSSDTPFNEAYFARMAYLLETNPEMTGSLKASGIKKITIDNINNFTGTMMQRVVKETAGMKDISVDISLASRTGYADHISGGEVAVFQIAIKDADGNIVKKAAYEIVNETFRNPNWHTAEDISEMCGKHNIKFEYSKNVSGQFYGETTEKLDQSFRYMQRDGVTNIVFKDVNRLPAGLMMVMSDISKNNGNDVRITVDVKEKKQDSGVAVITVEGKYGRDQVLVQYSGESFSQIATSKGTVYSKYYNDLYGHYLDAGRSKGIDIKK